MRLRLDLLLQLFRGAALGLGLLGIAGALLGNPSTNGGLDAEGRPWQGRALEPSASP
jgi:hypothetical protein